MGKELAAGGSSKLLSSLWRGIRGLQEGTRQGTRKGRPLLERSGGWCQMGNPERRVSPTSCDSSSWGLQ